MLLSEYLGGCWGPRRDTYGRCGVTAGAGALHRDLREEPWLVGWGQCSCLTKG